MCLETAGRSHPPSADTSDKAQCLGPQSQASVHFFGFIEVALLGQRARPHLGGAACGQSDKGGFTSCTSACSISLTCCYVLAHIAGLVGAN